MSPAASVTKAKKEQILNQLEGLKLLGEIISWEANGPHPYAVVKQALIDSALDEKIAKERLPKHAFARAARALSKDRVIDIVKEESNEIVFQFTGKTLHDDAEEGGSEWEFYKEAKLRLNKDTGKVTCKKNAALGELAQAELDKHIEQRTTSDITNLVQRLFSRNADLIPVRSAGGVYLVPIEHQAFTLKVDDFLKKLGGKVQRWPVPAGTNYGDANFQEAMVNYLGEMTDTLKESINSFDATTKPKDITKAAERINSVKLKIKAYAHYLTEKGEGLLKFEEESQRLLLDKLAALVAAGATPTPNGEHKEGE